MSFLGYIQYNDYPWDIKGHDSDYGNPDKNPEGDGDIGFKIEYTESKFFATALQPSMVVGSRVGDDWYDGEYGGAKPVTLKHFQVKTSPVMGWFGQTEYAAGPTQYPAEGNPEISWALDFNSEDLYTVFRNFPGFKGDDPSYAPAPWLEKVQNIVYGAPTKAFGTEFVRGVRQGDDQWTSESSSLGEFPFGGYAMSDPNLEFIQDLDEVNGITKNGFQMSVARYKGCEDWPEENLTQILNGYPQQHRDYTFWGKENIKSQGSDLPQFEHPEIDDQGASVTLGEAVRPIKGLPLRLQRIPLCILPDSPLYSCICDSASQENAVPGCEGSNPQVSGYFYTLATDPVLFTGSEAMPDGETFQWISEQGILPLSTVCTTPPLLFVSGACCNCSSLPQWDETVDYEIGDQVESCFKCYSYIYITPEAGKYPTNETYWELIDCPIECEMPNGMPINTLEFASGCFNISYSGCDGCTTATVYPTSNNLSLSGYSIDSGYCCATGLSVEYVEVAEINSIGLGCGLYMTEHPEPVVDYPDYVDALSYKQGDGVRFVDSDAAPPINGCFKAKQEISPGNSPRYYPSEWNEVDCPECCVPCTGAGVTLSSYTSVSGVTCEGTETGVLACGFNFDPSGFSIHCNEDCTTTISPIRDHLTVIGQSGGSTYDFSGISTLTLGSGIFVDAYLGETTGCEAVGGSITISVSGQSGSGGAGGLLNVSGVDCSGEVVPCTGVSCLSFYSGDFCINEEIPPEALEEWNEYTRYYPCYLDAHCPPDMVKHGGICYEAIGTTDTGPSSINGPKVPGAADPDPFWGVITCPQGEPAVTVYAQPQFFKVVGEPKEGALFPKWSADKYYKEDEGVKYGEYCYWALADSLAETPPINPLLWGVAPCDEEGFTYEFRAISELRLGSGLFVDDYQEGVSDCCDKSGGYVTISTSGVSGAGGVSISGVDCSGEPLACFPVDCIAFSSADFCIQTYESGSGSGELPTPLIHTKPQFFNVKATPDSELCSGTQNPDFSGTCDEWTFTGISELRFGSGFNVTDYLDGVTDCCDKRGGYVTLTATAGGGGSGDGSGSGCGNSIGTFSTDIGDYYISGCDQSVCLTGDGAITTNTFGGGSYNSDYGCQGGIGFSLNMSGDVFRSGLRTAIQDILGTCCITYLTPDGGTGEMEVFAPGGCSGCGTSTGVCGDDCPDTLWVIDDRSLTDEFQGEYRPAVGIPTFNGCRVYEITDDAREAWIWSDPYDDTWCVSIWPNVYGTDPAYSAGNTKDGICPNDSVWVSDDFEITDQSPYT